MVDVTVFAAAQVPPVVVGLLAAVVVEAGFMLVLAAEVVLRLLVVTDVATCVLLALVTTGLPGLVRPSLHGAWNCASASASVFVTALQPGSLGSQPLTYPRVQMGDSARVLTGSHPLQNHELTFSPWTWGDSPFSLQASICAPVWVVKCGQMSVRPLRE